MQQENNILIVIKTLAAGKTDKVMVKGGGSLVAPVIGTIVENYKEHIACHIRSGRPRPVCWNICVVEVEEGLRGLTSSACFLQVFLDTRWRLEMYHSPDAWDIKTHP